MKSKIITFFLLLCIAQFYAQTCFGTDATDPTVCTSAGKCVATDTCSCYSGYDGGLCDRKANTETCTFNNNTMTRTDYFPFLDSGSIGFANDELKLVIQAPLVNGRLNTQIYIQNSTFTDCAYPGANAGNYLDETGVCYNRFNYTLPWSTGKNCGWVLTEDDEQKVYSGNMYIDQIENLGEIRGEPILRTIKSVLPLTVTFQKRIAVVTSVKVFAAVNLIAAMTKQEYVEGPPKTGAFEFVTSLQYPYKIDNTQTLTITEHPTGLVPTLTHVTENCLQDEACTQKYSMSLEVDGACSFTGVYKTQFTLKCHESITNPEDCPLDASNDKVNVEFTVNSENFCSVVGVNINLQGTLSSYRDEAHTIASNVYLLGHTAYFKADLSSNQAVLQEAKLVRVQWTQDATTKVLYDNFAITADGTTQTFVAAAPGTNSASFKFLLDNSYLNVPVDSNLNFTVSALVEVKYQSIDGVTETAIKETTFSIKDAKALLATAAPELGTQKAKYSKDIKIYGIYAPTSSAAHVMLNYFVLLLSIYVILM